MRNYIDDEPRVSRPDYKGRKQHKVKQFMKNVASNDDIVFESDYEEHGNTFVKIQRNKRR
jgi:hypothetical protein